MGSTRAADADRPTPARVGVRSRRNPSRAAPASPAADVLRLQRAAGNAAVSRYLQRDGEAGTTTGTPTPVKPAPVPATVPPRKNYVFLMGDTKRDNFYIAADEFFKQNEKGAEIVRDKKTLSDVITHVNAGATPALKIIIVSTYAPPPPPTTP